MCRQSEVKTVLVNKGSKQFTRNVNNLTDDQLPDQTKGSFCSGKSSLNSLPLQTNKSEQGFISNFHELRRLCSCFSNQFLGDGLKNTKNFRFSTMDRWRRSYCKNVGERLPTMKPISSPKFLASSQINHVIAVTTLILVIAVMWSNMYTRKPFNEDIVSEGGNMGRLCVFCYLAAFATRFGAQIWMTFVSGLALYKALPRHTFALCQEILFPKYFALNSILSLCTLIMYVKMMEGRWDLTSYMQVIALSLCAFVEVGVSLYLAPALLVLMRERYKIENNFEMTDGRECQEPGYLVKFSQYNKIVCSFRRIHMTVAIGNLTTLTCTFLHLHYLTSKMKVG